MTMCKKIMQKKVGDIKKNNRVVVQ